MYVPPSLTIPWALIATILGIVSVSLQIYIMASNISSK